MHQKFGNTSLTMPRVVFGATCLGNLFVAMSDEQKRDLIREWFSQIPKPVAIDTAGKYGAGLSLEVLGRDLAALDIKPDEVVVSNKLAWRRTSLQGPEPTFEPGVWVDLQHDAVQDISHDGILRCHEDGCRMLGVYAPQLVSVHDPDEYLAAATDAEDRNRRMDDICGAYRALEELRDAGKVAGVGVGAKDWRIIRELDKHCRFDWVMMANSFTIMHHPPALLEFISSLQSRNIALINSAVTHGGFLVGGRFLDYREIDPTNQNDMKCLEWRRQFTEICQQFNASPYEVAVAFGVSHPAVTSVALSTSQPNRVRSMVSAATKKPVAAVWDELRTQGLIDAGYHHLNPAI
ncbi:aldo/keto reductase [Rubripirellula sp.]|nr:aldo/keto reductase [Rubripirellula sp.]MDA7874630.1 aldo/keto reductase [Rhodopirellula sp.]MDA7907225.1 aldo/keto reductase [bacterium]MDA8968187.1 aldo/keto reductase [bacterium]MDB4474954.1 aldo/keto reductase [bacterium]MDB4644937.1 aldo/keto reductase [Rubripirellula sp.]